MLYILCNSEALSRRQSQRRKAISCDSWCDSHRAASSRPVGLPLASGQTSADPYACHPFLMEYLATSLLMVSLGGIFIIRNIHACRSATYVMLGQIE